MSGHRPVWEKEILLSKRILEGNGGRLPDVKVEEFD